MSEYRADYDAGCVKACMSRESHVPHDWHGYPPDVWRCPGRQRLTGADIALLSEAFGGARPSELLISRVERIIAAHLTRVTPPGDQKASEA